MGIGALQALGGLGLFLLGMIVMTEGLRALAGGALRRWLARFTRSPLSGAVTGAATTAVVQSSSATTVAAVGFAGAGLLTFPQALGIVFGANVGTTITGWLVALLGFKLDVGLVMLPLVLVGALLRLFGRGRVAQVGYAAAGFGLVFVGIDALRAGMVGLEGVVTPASFPGDDVPGRLLLIGLGIGVTLVTQSSSAGVATALAGVNAGAISFPQAAALVIGMDVGTTVTAVVASLGGSIGARRTAAAHVIFNLFTATLAFALLPSYAAAFELAAPGRLAADPEIALVAFHTTFNVIGVSAALPFASRFADLVIWLVPQRPSPFAARLDASLLAEPEVALEAVAATISDLARKTLGEVAGLLGKRPEDRARPARLGLVSLALAETRRYVARITTPADEPEAHARHVAAMHTIDHLRRLVDRAGDTERWRTAQADEELRGLARAAAEPIERACDWLVEDWRVEGLAEAPERELEESFHGFEDVDASYRERTLARAAQGRIKTGEALHRLDALRWLRRVAYHAWRIVHNLTRIRLAAAAAPEAVPPHAEPEPRE